MGLRDKICIITGGGSGVGRATAHAMARDGARLVLAGRTASKVEAVQGEIETSGGVAQAFALDIADHEAVQDMVRSVLDSFGRIDVLVNNAGHSSLHRRLLTTPPEEIRRVIDSNLVGTVFCTQAVVPTMLEAKQGTIINVSSLAGVTPGLVGGMIYGAAKAGVINFTQFISTEFKNSGIRATAVVLGEVDTEAIDRRPVVPAAEARRDMVGAEDVAEAIALIARLPQRTAIPQIVIRPTMLRDPLTLIHRRTACRRPAEETKGCASESGIMVLKQKTGPRKGAPDRCYHVTTPTASKSPSTTTAWWPMPG